MLYAVEIFKIGNDIVDTRKVVIREHNAAVNNNGGFVGLINIHVHAYLADTAQKRNRTRHGTILDKSKEKHNTD